MPSDERGRRLADLIRQRVAQSVVGAIKRDERGLRRLRELGLVDDAWLGDTAADPLDLLRSLQRCAREIRERPSMLADLGLSPMDVLCCESDAPAVPTPGGGADLIVAFTDLEGFTAFTRREGDGEASRLLGGHYAAVDDIVAGRGGRVVKRLGDGHLLAFPQPRAAVLAALDLLEAEGGPLRLRVGEHAGSVVVQGDDVFGHVVNVASRVVGAAGGGQALVTTEVRDRAGRLPRVTFGEPQPTVLRGIEEAVPLCEVSRG
jgi:class 3 adenylate cyclase